MGADRSHAAAAPRTLASSYCQQYQSGRLDDLQFVRNVGLVMDHITWREHLFLHEIYRRARSVPGVVIDFGVHLGKDMAAFINLRSIYEPANVTRRVVGFDTFTGFPHTSTLDAGAQPQIGQFDLGAAYPEELRAVLNTHAYMSGLGGEASSSSWATCWKPCQSTWAAIPRLSWR